jgi:site-specific DNA-cytosine methylase
MDNSNKIKYGVIQPLSGGMVFGAINSLGYNPSWIISYPGLSDIKTDKSGNATSVGNEYNLLKWFKDHNCIPPYQLFNKAPFQQTDLNVELIDSYEWTIEKVDYSNTDLVLSVPVCSGLSQATIASEDTKNERNCNMLWNAEFTLNKINPKIYIFENAPLLFSNAGKSVRESLNDLAKKYDYSIVYYKTDTLLHDNCQRRPRTFVLFIKHRDGKEGTPDFNFENKSADIDEFFSRIPENSTQQFPITQSETSRLFMDYIHHKFGSDYRLSHNGWLIRKIIADNLYDDLCSFAKNSSYSDKAKDSLIHLITHIKDKVSADKNFYCVLPGYPKDGVVPAITFKTMQALLHHKEDRQYTVREFLHLMGMPYDYELHGDINLNYPKIGQNVPARTAQWIVSEAARIINNWDTIPRNNSDILFVDNIKQKIF